MITDKENDLKMKNKNRYVLKTPQLYYDRPKKKIKIKKNIFVDNANKQKSTKTVPLKGHAQFH